MNENIIIFQVSPPAEDNPRDLRIAGIQEPQELAWALFFRGNDARSLYLKKVRDASLEAIRNPQSDGVLLEQECERLSRNGDGGEALLIALSWWSGFKRKPYHLYRLKVGYPPFNATAVISFSTMEEDELRLAMALAYDYMEDEKTQMVEAFGLGGMFGLPE